jgi:hypothetical protein
MQDIVKKWIDKPDDENFYLAEDWDEPAECFASDNIAAMMASMGARQLPQRK